MHLSDDDLVLHYYGDAGADAARFDAHVAGCPQCRAALTRLGEVLALVEQAPVEAPDPGYERVLWARLQEQLTPAAPWWQRPWRIVAMRPALAGGLGALLLATFVAGWMARGGATPTAPAVATSIATGSTEADALRERVVLLEVGDHLQRSQMALVELINAGDDMFDVPAERARAADLVADNRLLRQSTASRGNEALDDVLEDLERVLVEVANGPDQVAPEQLRAWRERIAARGLLFRLRVLNDETRLRQQPDAAAPRKGPMS